MGAAIDGKTKFARGCPIQKPMPQETILDHIERQRASPFPIEGTGGRPARLVRIVADADARREDPLIHPVLQETRPAGNGRAIDGAGQMPQQTARRTRFINHMSLAGGQLLRIKPAHGPLTRTLSDQGRSVHIFKEGPGIEIIIPLHGRALSGNRRHGQAKAGAGIGAGETVARRQYHAAQPPGGTGSARTADTGNRKPGSFGGQRHLFQLIGGRLMAVQQLQFRQGLQQAVFFGKTRIGVLRGNAGHGNGPGGKAIEILQRVGRNGGGALSDENAQSDVIPLGALGFLDLAFPHLDAQRHTGDGHRIACIGACTARSLHKARGPLFQYPLVDEIAHGWSFLLVMPLFKARAHRRQDRRASPAGKQSKFFLK